jgi:hypothetical protein
MRNDPTLAQALEVERALAFAHEPKDPTAEEMQAAHAAGLAAGLARRPFHAVEYPPCRSAQRRRRHVQALAVEARNRRLRAMQGRGVRPRERRSAASSTTSSSDPGDDDPEPAGPARAAVRA